MRRADRNFAELLQELRVALTGVQILFAFLLGLCFTQRFAEIDEFQLDVYVVTLLASAATVALLIAPVAAHRLQFQNGRKIELVRLVHRCAAAGLCTLVVTMAGAILLVLDVSVGTDIAVPVTAAVAGWFLVLWLVIPIGPWRRLKTLARRRPDRHLAVRRQPDS